MDLLGSDLGRDECDWSNRKFAAADKQAYRFKLDFNSTMREEVRVGSIEVNLDKVQTTLDLGQRKTKVSAEVLVLRSRRTKYGQPSACTCEIGFSPKLMKIWGAAIGFSAT